MIIFHHQLKHERELMVPREVATWLNARNDAYPQVTFQVGHIVYSPEQRAQNRETTKDHSQSFIGGATPGIAQTTFLYFDEAWSIRIIGDLTAEERAKIVQLPPLTQVVRAPKNTILRKRSVEQPATARATEYVRVRQDRF